MRFTLIVLMASAAIVSATGCAHNNVADLVERIQCGNRASIAPCLQSGIDLRRLEEIELCLIAAGCELADATAEAVWFSADCRAGMEELRRRQDDETTTDATEDETTTTKKTTSKAKTTSAKTTSTTAPSTTEVTTTSESSTETTTSTSSESTATVTSSTLSTTISQTATAASGTSSTTLVCSVTSLKSTSVCPVSGSTTLSCTSTEIAISSCAPGVICFTATPGVCMIRKDTLDTSGTIVAVVFGVGLFATIVVVIALVMHGKRKAKQDEQNALLAAAAAKGHSDGRDVEAASAANTSRRFSSMVASGSDANLPLVTPGGVRSDQQYYAQQDYFQGARGGGDGLTPPEQWGPGTGVPPVPQLHQGLGALGQNPRY